MGRSRIKKFLPRTLFGRSLLILVTPVLLIQIITTLAFFDSHWGKITGRLAFAVAGEIAMIADQVEEDSSAENIKIISNYARQNLELLISYEENTFFSGGKQKHKNEIIVEAFLEALAKQVRRPSLVIVNTKEKLVEVRLQLDKGTLRVSLPQRRLYTSSVYIVLRWMIATSVILLMVAVLFMRNQIRPIRRLAVVAERFGKGMAVPSSFKPEGAREVRQAAQAFLNMQERISRQVQQRTSMLSGVSHDLRTPLTRMKLQVEMLKDCPDIEALKTDIIDMERMIDAYLEFARGEGGEKTTRTDLKEILERVVAGAKRQGVNVVLEIEGDLFLLLRPVAFERAVSNVINNACKYGGGNIWVAARRDDDGFEITVDDDGFGVPEYKREDVFRPFYRIDESRNSATGGVGLGLPIAQDIVHSHGGEISLGDSERGGLRVVIRVPV